MQLEWEGRQLKIIDKGASSLSFAYNADGIRTQKSYNGTKTYFTLDGDRIISQKTGSNEIFFEYDATGNVTSMTYNGNIYYYVRNTLGDILGLTDASGNMLVSYLYDPWGYCEDVVDNSGINLGTLNPFRYKGYYYDTETKLYYCNSRYYDPETSRFINADSVISGTGESVHGYNLFAYCFNNPINLDDTNGNWPRWITATVAAVAAVVAVVATVVSAPVVATAAAAVAVVSTVAYVAQSHHYDKRKAKNTSVPKTYDEAMKKDGADNTISAACHQFTAGDEPNKKVCWPDGTEGIYNSSGELVLDPRDVGTYNFSVPNGGWSSVWHGVVDVAPWIIFGNDDDDPGPLENWIISLFE